MFLSSLCSLPTSWLVTSSGVLVPSFHMSVSGTLGCFPGVDNSKGFFLEPASVAPSLRVFSLKSFDLHASVRALAEIASGGFETDSNATFLLSRCALCGLTRSGSSPLVWLHRAWVLPLFSVHLRVRDVCCVASPPLLVPPVPVWLLPLMWIYLAASEYDAPILVYVAGLCVLDAGCSRSIISCWSVQSEKTKLWEAYLFEALCAVFSPGHWANGSCIHCCVSPVLRADRSRCFSSTNVWCVSRLLRICRHVLVFSGALRISLAVLFRVCLDHPASD